MANAALLKGGVTVVLLLAVLAAFDSYGNSAYSQITGAQTAVGEKCPATIEVRSDKQTAYAQGETAVFKIIMRDSAGNIVKRGASLGITSTLETGIKFGKAFAATDSGIITVEEYLSPNLYPQAGYAVQVSSEAGDCSPVSGGQSLAIQAATTQIEVRIVPGWNIIGINTLKNTVSTTCSIGAGSGVYDFVDTLNPYENTKQGGTWVLSALNRDFKGILPLGTDKRVKDKEEIEKSQRLHDEYPDLISGAGAAWMYNYGDNCVITSKVPFEVKVQKESAFISIGWYLVSVQPSFVGRTIVEALEYRGATSSAIWLDRISPARKQVADTFLNPDAVFLPEDVGRGFWYLNNTPPS